MRSGVPSLSEGARRLYKVAASLRSTPQCAAYTFEEQLVCSPPGGRNISPIQDLVAALRQICAQVKKSVSTIFFVRLWGDSSRLVAKPRSRRCIVVVVFLLIIVPIISTFNFKRHFSLMLQLLRRNHLRPMLGIMERFNLHKWINLQIFHQNIQNAGVGAHHRNGYAERAIFTIVSSIETCLFIPLCIGHSWVMLHYGKWV